MQYEFERTVSNLICNFVVERLRFFCPSCVLYAPLHLEDYFRCKVLHCYPYCCDSIEPIFLEVRKYCRVCKWWYCLQNLRYFLKKHVNVETIIAFIRASIWITLWVLQQKVIKILLNGFNSTSSIYLTLVENYYQWKVCLAF